MANATYPIRWGYAQCVADNVGASTTAPGLAVLKNNANVSGFATGDIIYGTTLVPNDYIPGTDILVEFRYGTSTALGGNFVIDFEYTKASSGNAFPVTTVLTTGATAAPGVASSHVLYTYGTAISGSGTEIGDVISWRLLRNATGNTYAGVFLLLTLGFKYNCDVGSLGQNIKQY